MVDIIPFRGITYNLKKIKDIQLVLAPPYDVITPQMQRIYYEKHPNNIIRIIHGLEYPEDTQDNNRYTRAREYFHKWLEDKILVRSENPLLYLYEQGYFINQERRVRSGIIGLIRLEDYSSGRIFPHEETFEGPKEDRFRLLKECKANFSQIFSLYSDPLNEIIKVAKDSAPPFPVFDILYEGVEHKLWEIGDSKAINKIIELMKPKDLVIADGHHRYEAALNYRDFMRTQLKRVTGNEGFNYTMAFLSNIHDKGLTILPTHRVIPYNSEEFIKRIRGSFDIKRVKNEAQLKEELVEGEYIFGVVCNGSYYIISLKDLELLDELDINPLLKKLDVTLLHLLIIKRILNIEDERGIVYTKDLRKAAEIALSRPDRVAVILRPLDPLSIMKIARARIKLPHKTTYFYPKLLTGIVINSLTDGYDKGR